MPAVACTSHKAHALPRYRCMLTTRYGMVVVYVVAALLYQHAFRQFPVSQRVGSWKPKCIHPSHLWWRGCLGGIWESVWKGWHGITVLDHLPPSWAPDWNGGENSQLVPSSGKEEGCFRVRVVWLTELEDSNLGFKHWLVWTLRSSVKSIFLGVIQSTVCMHT